MPKNLSAWLDLVICLVVMAVLVAVIYAYNPSLAGMAAILWLSLAVFVRERCRYRAKKLSRYTDTVLGSVGEMMAYAVEKIPQGVLIINQDGRIEWSNEAIVDFLKEKPENETDIKTIWPNFDLEEIWGQEGELVFQAEERFFRIRHRQVKEDLMALYIRDVTRFEELKAMFKNSRAVALSVQIDNFDEVTQGLTDAELTNLMMTVRQTLDEWIMKYGGLIKRTRDDGYFVLLTREALDKVIAEKFDILDKIRQIEGSHGLPVTISAGGAIAGEEEREDMATLGEEAKAKLDLALGRGGDQVAIMINGKTQFFGGRTKAVERHTRVKARVVALACREIMENADVIYVMGHIREDFDSFGAAMGVARMARHLKKEVHVILSSQTDAIDKSIANFREKEEYRDLFISADEVDNIIALSPVLFVVDAHVPNIFAAKSVLQKVPKVVVIDHHRRSEQFVKNPLLVYLEPSASSASELVTELIMYFSEHMSLGKLEATALFSGLVVDTKNFAVQTGVRTFEAAAYLRRAGADPVSVREMFKQDFDATVSLAVITSNATYYEGGLIVSTAPEYQPNIQVLAAQAADLLLTVENVNTSIVIYPLKNAIGVCARSAGDINVQVIMEHFGGGGHQNVAGAQIEGKDMDEVTKEVMEYTKEVLNSNKNGGK